MKVLVTGATGFIGNYVIEELLLSEGVEIIASSSSTEKAEDNAWFSQVTFVPHDISKASSENLFEKFGKPDVAIHLAWSGLPNYKDLFHFEDVLQQQYFFLKNLVQNGLSDLSVTGTCFEYGMQEGKLNECMHPRPDNPYALAKDTLRRFLETLQRLHPFDLKWVRLFYMYGKGQSPNSILSQLQKAIDRGYQVFNMSGGEQIRDYLPVEIVARNIVSIALQKKTTGIINCCSNVPITIRQLVEDYIKTAGASIALNTGYYPYPDYEPFRFYGDNTKLKNILNE